MQVGEGQQVGGRCVERDLAGEVLVVGDVQEFAGGQRAPVRVFVHPFAGHHDGRCVGEVAGAYPYGAGCASVFEVAMAVVAAGRAGQYVQRVGVGVAQRPQVGRRGQDEVQRVQGQVRRDPADRIDDGAAGSPSRRA